MAKTKLRPRKIASDGNDHTVMLGALAGTLLGAGAALFLASKSGRNFRGEIADTCHHVADKACELKDCLVEQGEDLYEKVHEWVAPEEETHTSTNLVLGGLAGGLLGATAIYFACHPSCSNEETFIDKAQHFTTDIKDKTECWITKTKDVLDKINEVISDTREEVEEDVEEVASNAKSNLSRFMDLASLGFRLYNSVKQGR